MKQHEAQAKAEMLLKILEKRFKAVPDDLRTVILAVKDPEQLNTWVDVAFAVRSLRCFREQVGL
jgi:hypothetical protein